MKYYYKIKHLRVFFICSIAMVMLVACVTTVTNSDGSVTSGSVDKQKLAEIYTKLAVEYQNKGALPIALSRVNLAIEDNGNYAQAYMVRATIYQQLKKPDLARHDFDVAIKLDKDSANIKTNYAIFLCEEDDYVVADKLFAEALNNPLYETPELGYLARGNCYYKQHKLSLANADYLQALSYKSVSQNTYITIASLQFEENNYTLADFYVKQYQGKDTAQVLLLKIKITDKLLEQDKVEGLLNQSKDDGISSYKKRIKTLGANLLKQYPNSEEAQVYLTMLNNNF